jgi:Domain of unknown function (DUF4386)
MLIYGARQPAVRPMALTVAGARKAIFVVLVLSHGGRFFGYQAGIAVLIDALWVMVSRRTCRRLEALRDRASGPMRVEMLFAVLAALSMMLGLMRWPSVHWELARGWAAAAEGDRLVLAAVFDGLNRYLGNFIGEFLGELGFSIFFVLSGVGLSRHPRSPRWLSWWGIAAGVLGLIGMWRNVMPAADVVAAANNYLLPTWMIGFAVWLLIASRTERLTAAHV